MKPFNQKLPMSAALICMLLFTALSAQNLSERIVEGDVNHVITNFKAPISKAMYDLQFAVDFTSTGIVSYAGAECDGVNLYASVWNSGDISVFTVTGTFVETFSIPGVIGTRDMAFDGTYFYGGAASSTMYQMDFDSQTVVSSISTGASGIRALAYDGEDGFFYANNWADDITLFDISGAVVNIISYPETTGGSSTYGMAYDNVSDGGPFLWLTQSDANGDVWLSRMNLASGTLTDEILDIATTVGGAANASYGGLWIEHTEAFPTTYTIGGMLQGEIYMAYGYELASAALTDDVQVSGFASPSSGMALGVEEVIVVIKNKGTAAQTAIPFEVTVEGAVFYTGTTTLTLAMGETEEVYCGTIDMSQGGNWDFEGCTSLVGDENPDNDCSIMSIWGPLICDPITDLAVTVSNGEVNLTWTAPEGDIDFYEIYRDGSSIGTTDETFFNTAIPSLGTFEYCVEAVYTSGCIADQVCVTIWTSDFETPTDLYIVSETPNSYGGEDVLLTWSHSECGGGGSAEWIGYDDGINNDAIGGPDTYYVAARWEAEDISAYDGYTITKMAIHPYAPGSTGTAQINLMIWSGANAANVLMDEALTSYTLGDWNEFNLANPPTIDGSQELWMGYFVASDGASYPAGCDAGPAIADYGDMISMDGVIWESMSTAYGLDYNWNIQAYVESGKTGSSVTLGKTKVIASTTTLIAQGAKVAGTKFAPKGFVTFVLFDDYGTEVGATTGCEYLDTIPMGLLKCYTVIARYDEGDSDPCINTSCTTRVSDIDANTLNIYPNPASTSLFIESGDQIDHVTVYNMLGQLVYDREVSETGVVKLNTSNYETGLYLIKVQIADKISIDRITVVN